jgi:serine/threonine-protein kinase HipA
MNLEALFRLFEGLPRQGPGTDRATREATSRLPRLPENPVILDLGCGAGAQTLVLARELAAPITAVDIYRPYLDQLEQAANDAGLGHLITARQGDMADLKDIPPASVDLIWCEGAIFIAGFRRGLNLWRPLLKIRGLVVVSEMAWFVPDPPAEAERFFKEAYPPMTDVAGNLAMAAESGYRVLDHFPLEATGWQDEFYHPLKERIARLRALAASDPDLNEVIQETETEMEMYDRFGHAYGYEFFLMQKAG